MRFKLRAKRSLSFPQGNNHVGIDPPIQKANAAFLARCLCSEAFASIKRAIAAALACCAPAAALAQAYPVKPVRLIVGFAPGGPNDIVARGLAQKLSEQTGQQFIVENRPGANTAVATEMVARAQPDGYIVMFVSPGHATNPSLMKLNFDSIRDFSFVTQVADAQNILVVHPSLPVRSVKELIAFAKARPGEINYGSSGSGSTGHLSTELFQLMTGTKLVHVPYKGVGPALIDVLAGQITMTFGAVPGVLPYARSGRLRVLGVTGAKRISVLPELPTVAEAGVPGYEATLWFGVLAPAGVPMPIVNRLHGVLTRALQSQDMKDRLTAEGAEPIGNTPQEFQAFIKNEIERWAVVVKASGMKAE